MQVPSKFPSVSRRHRPRPRRWIDAPVRDATRTEDWQRAIRALCWELQLQLLLIPSLHARLLLQGKMSRADSLMYQLLDTSDNVLQLPLSPSAIPHDRRNDGMQNPAFKDQLSSSSGGSIDSALTSAAPSPRPGLSRTSSVNYSVEADDSFTGLTLLDALVVLDSHLDLARRQISRKGQEWKSRAESTAVSVKRQAEEVLNQRRIRRRVTTNAEDDKNERIDIDREVAKFRKNVSNATVGYQID